MCASAGPQWAADTCALGGGAGALFAQLLATLAQAQCLLSDRGAYPPDAARPLPEYDFVVVGAGSAGSAVAARLSENPTWRVLLLEAGGDPPPTSDVPALFPTLLNTEVDWSYVTEPNTRACQAHKDGRCHWPRGKALGGSSTINGMNYIRGSPQDYDSWAALGNVGWSYRDVLPFFKKLEDFDEEEIRRRPHVATVHGRHGAIRVSKPARLDPAFDTLDSAARELGYRIIQDFSAEPNVGFGQVHCNIWNGSRWNSALGYLGPAKERPNLHIVKSAYVTKVLVEPQMRVAYGVQYLKGGKVEHVRATKEVILSGGVVGTPHILMHSGIGPKDHLEDVGIPVIHDLKVGHNLQDHVAYSGLVLTRKSQARNVNADDIFQYFINRTGILATTDLASYFGFVQTETALHRLPVHSGTESDSYPDIQLMIALVNNATYSAIANFMHFGDEATSTLKDLTESEDVLIPLVTLLAPRSRGRIRLRSADPVDLPLIETGYLSDPRDLDRLLAGIEAAQRLGSTEAMRRAGYTLQEFPLLACRHHEPLTPDYWLCAVPHLAASGNHPVGTAKMGPSSDDGAVVDARLRVHGVRGLRVADASVMPLVVRCNTNVPTMMIGEKCAHMVAEEWNHSREQLAEVCDNTNV